MDNVKKFKEIANSLGELYEQKNKCYNNSFGDTYKKLGIISAVTRISDKYNRLCNLATNPDIDNLGESIEDTLKDMAAYAIMTLIELDNNKPVGVYEHNGGIAFKGDICISPNVKQWDICISPDTNQWDTSPDDWEELDEAKTLNVGDKMLCIKTVFMDDDTIAYIAGRTYNVEQANCITDEQEVKEHGWGYDCNNHDNYWQDHFRKVK